MRILVVGGNAAGMTAASRAKRLDPGLTVTVLEAGPRIAYSICGLPYYVGGVVSEIEELVLFTPEKLQNERGIEARVGHRVVELRPSQRRVVVESRDGRRDEGYDRLLLSTGYRPVTSPLPAAATELSGVFTASRLGDGEAIHDWLSSRQAPRAVIVGGGYIGLEVAEALRRRGADVRLVEASSRVLSSLDPDLSRLVLEELEANGVRVHLERVVRDVTARGDRSVEAVELGPGTLRLPADVVFVDVGVEPRVELAELAGIVLGPSGAIQVSEHLETSCAGVYAAGNCAEAIHLVSGRPVTVPLGTVAAKQGRVAGENLAGRRSTFKGVVGTSVVRVFGLSVARTGLSTAEAESCGFQTVSSTIRGRFRASYFGGGAPATVKAIADRSSGRLLGAQIVGSEEGAIRIDVAAAALTAGMTVSEVAQLDLGYAPPLGALWSPLHVAMNTLLREL